jgi:ectoine hydrolase
MREIEGLHFQIAEYRARVASIQAEMQRRGIDALLLSDPCNLYYACGYDAWSFYVPQMLVVPGNGEELVWIGREMDAHRAVRRSFRAGRGRAPDVACCACAARKRPREQAARY